MNYAKIKRELGCSRVYVGRVKSEKMEEMINVIPDMDKQLSLPKSLECVKRFHRTKNCCFVRFEGRVSFKVLAFPKKLNNNCSELLKVPVEVDNGISLILLILITQIVNVKGGDNGVLRNCLNKLEF